MERIKLFDLVSLLRPQQWLKNSFIFLPLFFDKHLGDIHYLIPAFVGFLVYCFAASSIYCFNDIYDVESDRQHPKKCHRPIASGAISKRIGYCVMGIMLILAMSVLFLFSTNNKIQLLGIIVFYYLMNLSYCIKLKNIALLDVTIIAIGFVLRIIVGGVATGIWISHWIVLMTFLLALFLAFAKRRDDVVIYEKSGKKMRHNINRYNLAFMNQAISIVASITMVCYIMYTVSEEVVMRMQSSYLYVTSIFVLIGILRYLQLTIVDIKSGSPTKVLMKDHFIQICIVGWLLTFFFIIYT